MPMHVYFDPELVDFFVENKNSDIKVICSDLHIFCHNVSVQDKGKNRSSRYQVGPLNVFLQDLEST